jgi:hypothetical protein
MLSDKLFVYHSRWTKYKWQGRRKMKKIVREFLNAEIVRTCFALVFKEEKKKRKVCTNYIVERG